MHILVEFQVTGKVLMALSKLKYPYYVVGQLGKDKCKFYTTSDECSFTLSMMDNRLDDYLEVGGK